MTDPLSVTASIAGVLSLGIYTSQTLFNYYKAVQGRNEEVARITRKLQGVLELLKWTQDEINKREGEQENDQVDLIGQVNVYIQECKGYIDQLGQEAKKFGNPEKQPPKNGLKSRSKRVVYSLRKSFRITSLVKRQLTYPFHQETMQKLEKNIMDTISSLKNIQDLIQYQNDRRKEEKVDKVREIMDLVRADQVQLIIHQWFKAPDATTNFEAACDKRHKNTGLWLVNGPAFATWLKKPNSFLWLYGSTGTGKSVLSSAAIQYAFLRRDSHPGVGVAFFFFKFDDRTKQDASDMLRAVIMQLSSQTKGAQAIRQLYASYGSVTPPRYALMDCLGKIAQEFQDIYIVLDALDECPRDQRHTMLQVLVELNSWSKSGIHVLATSRDEVDIRETMGDLADDKISMRNDEVEKDMALFISQRLASWKRLQKWERHHERIRNTLIQRADNNFRWVECQFQALGTCVPTEELLDDVLGSLPRGLDETYRRVLANIPHHIRDYARRTLMFLCYAIRPLKLAELTDAVAVDPGSGLHLYSKRKLPDVESILALCPGFIELKIPPKGYLFRQFRIDDEPTIHIAHFSVQEYLESTRILEHPDLRPFAMDREEAHMHIFKACLMFLLESSSTEYPILTYASTYWPHHLKEVREPAHFEHQVMPLFRHKNDLFSKWVKFCDVTALPNPPRGLRYYRIGDIPLAYASYLGYLSITSILLDETISMSPPVSAESGDEFSEDEFIYTDSFNTIFDRGRAHMVLAMALRSAATAGQEEIIHLFLNRRSELVLRHYDWQNVLYHAAYAFNERVVKLLMDNNITPDGRNEAFKRSLLHIIKSDRESLLRLLLDNTTCIDHLVKYEWWSDHRLAPLEMAIQWAGEDCTRILLDKGFDVNERYRHWDYTPLILTESTRLAELLLERGADVDIQDRLGETALFKAAARGDRVIFRMLLDRGADVCIPNYDNQTPLMIAISKGHEAIARILIQKYEDIDASDSRGQTALFKASSEGCSEAVRLLLEKGADIYIHSTHATCTSGKLRTWEKPERLTALDIAEKHKHKEIVQMILAYREMIRPGSRNTIAEQTKEVEGRGKWVDCAYVMD